MFPKLTITTHTHNAIIIMNKNLTHISTINFIMNTILNDSRRRRGKVADKEDVEEKWLEEKLEEDEKIVKKKKNKITDEEVS